MISSIRIIHDLIRDKILYYMSSIILKFFKFQGRYL